MKAAKIFKAQKRERERERERGKSSWQVKELEEKGKVFKRKNCLIHHINIIYVYAVFKDYLLSENIYMLLWYYVFNDDQWWNAINISNRWANWSYPRSTFTKEKGIPEYAANLKRNTQAKVWFQKSCFATLLKSHFGIGVSCKFAAYFQNTFSKNISEGLLLNLHQIKTIDLLLPIIVVR